MRKFLTGAALGVLALTPLHADPGGGHGGGGHGSGGHGGGGHGGQAQGGGNPHGNPGGQMQGGQMQAGRGHGNGGNGWMAMPGQAMRDNAQRPHQATVQRQVEVRREVRAVQAHEAERAGRGHGGWKHQQQGNEVRTFVRENGPVVRSSGVISNSVIRTARQGPARLHGRDDRGYVIDGCPPGLARKNNGCMPPGLARTTVIETVPWQQPSWYGANWYGDRYRYYDGYMLRMGPDDRVLGYVPLLGGALAVGEAWPADYQQVGLPDYYRTFYDLGPADSYRYYDDTIYGVDPGDDLITSVIALLTGDSFNVGDVLPAGYDVYNVPYEYRDQYVDGPDAMYRYSDGYVYEVDPQTRLIQAAIQLLTA